jgi:hypothetical protein
MKKNKKDIELLIKRILLEEVKLLKEQEEDDDSDVEKGEKWSQTNDPDSASTWEKLKYVMGRLGSYKVNGKFFGKKKELKAAKEKIKVLINKESNKFIKDLDQFIKKTNKEFPNNLKGADFLSIVMSIAATYDSIVDAVKKEEMPVDAANGVINDLREYVKFILDAKLSAAYSTVDESTEQDYKELYEAFGLQEDQAADIRAKFKADRAARAAGDDKDDYKSTKIDTLKSNKLPLTLAGVGASMGAFSWLVNTEWFKSLFDVVTPDTWKDGAEVASEQITDIKDGEGVYKLLGRVTGNNLDGNSSPSEFVNALKQIGGGDANKGVDLLCQEGGVMMKPEEAKEGLKEFLKNPNDYKNMNDLFHGSASGTGKLTPTDTTLYGTISGRQLTSVIMKILPKIFVKGSIKTGAGYAIAKGLGGILGPIGVGLLAAGATVKLMRMKGLKTSRAATLNALYQSLRNLPSGEIIKPEGPIDTKIEVPISDINPATVSPGDTGATSGKQGAPTSKSAKVTDSDDLYNTLKKVLKMVVNSRKKVGTRSADNVGMDGAGTRSGNKKTSNAAPIDVEDTEEDIPDTPKTSEIEVGKKYTVVSINGRRKRDIVVDDIKNGKATIRSVDEKPFTINRKTVLTPQFSIDVLKKMVDRAQKSKVNEAYISDKDMRKYLSSSLSFDKLQTFEELLKLIENLRNKIRGAQKSKDSEFNKLIDNFSSNPIMSTDFKTMFDVSMAKDNRESIKALIDDVFLSLYSSKFGRENLIDKMSSAGGGNINALQEKEYSTVDPNKSFVKDSQSRDRFKGNLIKFLQDSVRLFQHMYSRRKQK